MDTTHTLPVSIAMLRAAGVQVLDYSMDKIVVLDGCIHNGKHEMLPYVLCNSRAAVVRYLAAIS